MVQQLERALDTFAPTTAKEQTSKQQILDLLPMRPAALFRDYFAPGHLTGSGFLFSADGQRVFVGEPQVVKEQLGLRAGVVKDQRGLVFLHLLQHRRNGVFRAAAGPWRGLVRDQHLDIRIRAGIGQKDIAGVGMTGEQVRDLLRVIHGGRQSHAAQIGTQRLQPRQGQHQLIAPLAFGQCVDFIHDHALQPFEHARGVFVAGQQRKAFRRCQQDMGRVGALAFLAA